MGKHWLQRADEIDTVVERALLRFVARPDLVKLLVTSDPAAEKAAERALELRAELARAPDLHRARKLTLDSLVAMESWAVPELEQAEAAARPRHVPRVVFELAEADDPAVVWKARPVPVRRQAVRALHDVRSAGRLPERLRPDEGGGDVCPVGSGGATCHTRGSAKSF